MVVKPRRADPASVRQLAAGFCGLGWARASLALAARGMIHQNRLLLALILVALLLHAGFADGEQDSTVGCIRGDCSEGVMPSLLEGEFFFDDGAAYKGNFRHGAFHGHGEMNYPGGDRYTGKWRKGLRHGKGVLITKAGASYKGRWVRDSPEGKGKYTYASGAEYRGEFKVGQFDGVGTYVYPDDSEYRGHWKQGKREGFGRMEMPSGDAYEGVWRDGEWDPAQGRPVYFQVDGKRREL